MMEKLLVLVCVTGQKTCERLIVEGAKKARELGADLSVVHVARKEGSWLIGNAASEGEALEYLYKISTEHGADMTVIRADDVLSTLAAHARKVGAVMMVLGAPAKGDAEFVRDLQLRLPEMEFHVVFAR